MAGLHPLTAQTDDFATIKQRVIRELLKVNIEPAKVEDIFDRMQEDGSFQDINYEDLSRTASFPHRRHTSDLVYLARAYRQQASPFFRQSRLKEAIVKSLQYWVKHDFFGDNWHNNQISTPTNLVNLMLLIGEELPVDLVEQAQPIIGRAHMNASGARPSGDRIVIAGILAKNLLFTGNQKHFDEIIRLIEGEVKFSTGKRGIQHDYSFHHRHDRVNNTVSYGYGKYANAFGEWSYYVANTQYAFSIEKINRLVDYYLDGIYKQLVYGTYMDISVKNRSITHKAVFKPQGTLEVERLLFSTDYRKAELEEIIRLRKGEIQPSQSFCKFFWQTEHLVVQRPDFYTTVRMFSTRNRNMEVPYNGPGKPTHHRADGTNYLQLKGDEYHNIWPVYDWQKVSGTTIMQKPKLPPPTEIQKEGLTDFVGAVTDGYYGSAVFDFRSPHDGLTAKKSWFFFDDAYVCLGASIRSHPRLPVVTTLNQVRKRSVVTIQQNRSKQQLPEGQHDLPAINWVHQDRVGYLFPKPERVHIANQVARGRWSDITDQKNISTAIVEEDIFGLWLDHGLSPDSAGYAYLVFPNVSAAEMEEIGKDHQGIKILSNTDQLQAVMHEGLEIYQMAFYQAGELKRDASSVVRMFSQGMLMLKMQGGRIGQLTVADPSRKLGKVVVEVPGIYQSQQANCTAKPDAARNLTQLIIDLPQGVYAGKSVQVELEKGNR